MHFNSVLTPRTLLTLGLLWAALHAGANNIQVSNATLTGSTGTSVQIQFDLSWENSWRGGAVSNWDAAWVFVKYRTSNGLWQHVNLNNTGHVPASGSQIDLGLLTPGTAYNASTNPVVGVFIYRNATGTGNLSLPGTQLRWNYATLGLSYADITQVQVFAIEMVYVPQGAFAAGSGGTEFGAFTLTTINTSMATEPPTVSGSLGGNGGGYPTGDTNAPISATWPNGFSAFYCMKYEISQQQYVDFLNTLTYNQQESRTLGFPSEAAGNGALDVFNEFRNGIDIHIPGVDPTLPAVYACNLNGNSVYGEATDGKEVACNYLGWYDLAAYLDWSGLRPMSELEFEKACRGTVPPVANEFPWGTTGVSITTYTYSSAGAANEGIATNYSTTLGNAVYDFTNGTPSGPKRVGLFAANGANNGRVSAGASYYGIMELGGNVYERVVVLSNQDGRIFTGRHGDGTLLIDGNPDVSNWPGQVLPDANGAGFRGGAWSSLTNELRVSFRSAQAGINVARTNNRGGRGVRSTP